MLLQEGCFHIIARRIFFRFPSKESTRERASYVLIGSLQGFCRRRIADSLLRLVLL